MNHTEQRKRIHEFIKRWTNCGYEKGESQTFWLDLLSLLCVESPADFIRFESQVHLDHTSFIDGFIETTHVLIEQKSLGKDLRSPIKQSDGTWLNPFQQAKRYAAELPYSERPRWIVTCNFAEFLVYDMEQPNSEPASILLKNLEKELYRLNFLVKTQDATLQREMELSLKAGELVGRLYDALLAQYIDPTSPQALHSLNALCVRLVFCLYAEDAGLFGSHTAFHDYLASFHSDNVRDGLIKLFRVLDTKPEARDPYERPTLLAFPYINGGLFRDEKIEIPRFTPEILHLLLNDCSADFNWSGISPTIFGAVFESTLNPETRRSGGMHYTSIENIHKVIDPLFLDDLTDSFHLIEKISQPKKRNIALHAFQDRLASLRFLDPACGSGNFLTETFLSLRRLENRALKLLYGKNGERSLGGDFSPIKVNISQFYGIEINDFATTVAKTALWIAESQMMQETEDIVGRDLDFLPLKTYTNITEGNALRLDWRKVIGAATPSSPNSSGIGLQANDNTVGAATPSSPNSNGIGLQPNNDTVGAAMPPSPNSGNIGLQASNIIADRGDEASLLLRQANEQPVSCGNEVSLLLDSPLYIMGNPPFVGYSLQSKEQKADILSVFVDERGKPYKTAGKIDYVAGWYYKAAQLIQGTEIHCAFVFTNSITQGEQVAAVWKPLHKRFGIHIDFAHRTFRWDSEASLKAHVHCVIVGFSSAPAHIPYYIYDGETKTEARHINAYLIDAPDVFVESRAKALCDVPPMVYGNKPVDGGFLFLTEVEREEALRKEPQSAKFIHRILGSEEYINNKPRYCYWLVGATPAEIRACPMLRKRVEGVRTMRLASPKAATRQSADTPTLFQEIRQPSSSYIIVPRVSSERRRYIPIGFVTPNIIVNDSVQIIPNATLYHFGVLTSNVHMAWMRAVCGRLKSDYRYSKDVVYNNFPWPNLGGATPSSPQGKAAPCGKSNGNGALPLLKRIEQTAQAILDARALYPDSTLADLYNEALMPPELRRAHQANDRAVMVVYSFPVKGFTESDCVATLMRMYQELTK